jgi:hypothetical protein
MRCPRRQEAVPGGLVRVRNACHTHKTAVEPTLFRPPRSAVCPGVRLRGLNPATARRMATLPALDKFASHGDGMRPSRPRTPLFAATTTMPSLTSRYWRAVTGLSRIRPRVVSVDGDSVVGDAHPPKSRESDAAPRGRGAALLFASAAITRGSLWQCAALRRFDL